MCMPFSQSPDRLLGVASLARTFDAQNQLLTDGSATLGFDANGNVTTDDHGNTLVYDSWNRLVEVKASNGTIISGYSDNPWKLNLNKCSTSVVDRKLGR